MQAEWSSARERRLFPLWLILMLPVAIIALTLLLILALFDKE